MNTVTNRFKERQGTFEVDLGIQHHFSDGLYAKQMLIPAGSTVGQHKHTYSHLSILSQGCVTVQTDFGSTVYTAPACISLASGINHEIQAHEDSVWYCIHATDCDDPELVDEVLIHKGT